MTPNGVKPVAHIEIVKLSDGQLLFKMEVPSRYEFNAMIETAKQEGLKTLFNREQQKVVAPAADAAQRLKL